MRSCWVKESLERRSRSEQRMMNIARPIRPCCDEIVGPGRVGPQRRYSLADCSPLDCRAAARRGHGDFWADYRFWRSEDEIIDTLQDTNFLFLGREHLQHRRYESEEAKRGQDEPARCWVHGLIIRTKKGDEAGLVWERIGWLRYCCGEPLETWAPFQLPRTVLTLF